MVHFWSFRNNLCTQVAEIPSIPSPLWNNRIRPNYTCWWNKGFGKKKKKNLWLLYVTKTWIRSRKYNSWDTSITAACTVLNGKAFHDNSSGHLVRFRESSCTEFSVPHLRSFTIVYGDWYVEVWKFILKRKINE